MKRVLYLMLFLIAGLILSQVVPLYIGELSANALLIRQVITMTLLSFIMIEVGREFEIDLKNKKQYVVDYFVAATAATFPWIFVFAYFYMFLLPEHSASGKALWIEALLAARFAAPTSAGVLFSMLAAAGLSSTWTYKKTRILAIFDDLDTVLLMIPLQILMVGFVWQLGGILLAMSLMVVFGIKYFKKLSIPCTIPWVLFYAFMITFISEVIYFYTKDPVTKVGMHIEILLPAFILGCCLKSDHAHPPVVPGEDLPGESVEESSGLLISCIFLFLVGFSMPLIFGQESTLSFGMLMFHTLVVTIISNIGKMFACLCYKKEATFKERLAVSFAMFPRGEVGAGVLAMSVGYGIAGPFINVAFLSLAVNLLLTGFFIYIVKKLLSSQNAKR